MSSKSLDLFLTTLDRLSGDSKNADVNYAIESWLIEFAISKKLNCNEKVLIENIKNWNNSADVSRLTLSIYRTMVFITNKKLLFPELSRIAQNILEKIDETMFKQTVQETLKDKKMEENMETKLILLIAFVLTGVGVALYLLDRNKGRSNRATDYRQPVDEPDTTHLSTPIISRWILVLVIKADGSESLIKALKQEKRVTSEYWDSLYRANKGLWMGTERAFDNSDELERYFTEMSEVPENERSGYDVNFVKIKLYQPEPKFERGVNSMERADAFQELPDKEHEVIRISPRLSCRTYDNDIFYR